MTETRDEDLMWRPQPRTSSGAAHPTQRLQEALEAHLVTTHVRGPAVLHVGIGAGRGLLPLLQAGLRVTGVDAEGPLVAVRGIVADLPPSLRVELRAGDVSMPPGRDSEFDSVLALGALERVPAWRDAVRAWSRAVRPGGVVVFDAPSHEQHPASPAAPGVAELVEFAQAEGLTLKALAPWGAFLGGHRPNALLRPLEQTHRWRRLLSWFAGDDALLELGLFLELFVVAHLHPRVAGQVLVVLERAPDDDGAHELLTKRLAAMDAASRARDLAAVEEMLPVRGDELRAALEKLVAAPRARMFVSQLYDHARAQGVMIDRLLSASTQAWCARAFVAGRADAALMELLDGWTTRAEATSLQPGLVRMLGYPMASRILSRLPREQP